MQISYCNVPDAKTVFGKSYQNVSWNSLRSVDIWKLVFLKIAPKNQIAYFERVCRRLVSVPPPPPLFYHHFPHFWRIKENGTSVTFQKESSYYCWSNAYYKYTVQQVTVI